MISLLSIEHIVIHVKNCGDCPLNFNDKICLTTELRVSVASVLIALKTDEE
jgi:hypothetical protein